MATLGRFDNTDFEQGTAYWKLDAGATIQTATPRSGKQYLQIASSVSGFTHAYAADLAGANQRYLSVIPGQTVQFGGWMYRSAGAGNGYIGGAWYDSTKTLISQFFVQAGAGSGAWAWYSSTAIAPANAAFVSLYPQVDNTATTILFDDIYMSLGLDVQTYSGGAYTCQTSYLQYQSLTLKFNTFDLQLVDPTIIPNLGDTITAIDPNIALNWSGVISKINHTSISEKGGHTFVTVSATNTNVALASVAPFDLSDGSQPLRNWVLDGPMQDATLAALQNSYVLGTPAEFSLDTVNFHDGTQSLKETTTRTAVGWNTITPNMPGGHTPTGAYSTVGQVFAVAPGQTYSVSLWVKALAGSKQNHLKVLWFKDTASTLSLVNTTTYVVGGTDGPFGWVQWSGTATAPQDARYAMIQVMAGYWDGVTGTNGQFWCQDLTWGGYAKFREAQHSYSKDQGGTNKTSSSYLTQQTGLWPLQTVDITNADLGLINASYSVTEVSMTWDIDHITPWQRITVGDPVVTMSVWLNSTNAGILPITTTKISDGAVTTPKVAANAITAAQIAAGAITADKLTATLVLASLIKAGSGVAHVEMDQNGLRAYDGSGNLVVNIPTDGVSPVTINANVLAKSLIVSGNSVFDGAKNEIALGATLQLDSSLQNPAQAPSVAQTWNSVSLPINSTYDLTSTTYSRVGLAYDSAGGAGGTTAVYWQATQNSGSKDDYLLELLTTDRSVNRSHDLTSDGFKTPLDVCRLGSYVYVLGIDGGTGSPSNWGQTSGATYSYDFTGSGSDNQISTASAYTAPGSGTITSMTIRCAGYGANCGFYFCVWDGSGNILAYSAYTTLGSTLGDQTLGLSLKVTSGTSYYFGFWADRTGSKQWGVDSSGSFDYQTNLSGLSSLSGRAACSSPYVCGTIRAFVTYTPDTRVWKVRRYLESTLALDATYPSIAYLAAPTQPKICSDGTNIFIVDRASGANIKWQKYDGTMATVGALADSGYNPGNSVNAAFAGNADIGAWRMFVLTGSTVDDFDSTPTRQSANEGFSTPAAAYGLTYDGTRFFSLPTTGGSTAINLTSHSTWVWTTASSVYWVAYTWYDSQVSHIHETQVSPYSSITLSRRAQLVITTPSIPGTGGLDDPNNINFYALPNATQPGTGAAHLQIQTGSATVTMTSYSAAGAADPSTNNFPAGTPGQFQSEIGNTIIKGDGTAQFGQGINVLPSNGGSLAASSWGSVPVKIARVVSPAGSSFTLGPNPLPTGFSHLEVKFMARSGANTSASEQGFRFNNDSAANYTFDRYILAASYVRQSQGATWQTYGRDWFMSAATATAGWTGGGRIFIPNYNDTHFTKVAQIDWFYWTLTGGLTTNAYEWDSTICGWNNSVAITRLDFFELNSGGWATGSVFELWGWP